MSIRMFIAFVMALVVGVAAASAQDVRPQQPLGMSDAPDRGQVMEPPSARYRLQSGDVMELGFPFTPEFDQTVTIQPDGFVVLQAIGEVEIGGLTVAEASRVLEEQYSVVLREPMITVRLTEFEGNTFIASGEVASPGKYEMKGDVSIVEAVAIAGGFTSDARHSQVLLFRRASEDWVEVREFDLRKLLKGELEEDVELMPGDMVHIPKKRMASLRPFLPVAALRLFFSPF